MTKELGKNVSQVFRLLPQVSGNIRDALRVLPRAAGDGPFMVEQIATIDFNPLAVKITPPPNASALSTGAPVLATGGDISRDGTLIAIRTYGGVWVWQRPASASMADVFATQPCEATSAVEQQGEAVAFDPDGTGYTTVSEGESPALNHFVAK